MKVKDENELAQALLDRQYEITLTNGLTSGVKRIFSPSDIVIKPVIAAIGTMIVILGVAGVSAWVLISFAWSAILAISGGVGAIVAVVLGFDGAATAVKLAYFAKSADILITLRKCYRLDENNDMLIRM